MQNYNYPNIDMQRTGALLKKKVEEAGFTVKSIVACSYGRITCARESNGHCDKYTPECAMR